ncbi:23S rRNA (pseudouridine(1915)-N(3))-methyltransferase RlmH [Candidatus Methylopumilus rimovensis]|uniref:23S rRNA (pseudouridine(1915)-N(3))-methyltransferase RlmH n=1 Tax=Candidatus Methylopumilus rimovensis TaxID=2588535 RepID=UPI001123D478|nr:23S rRNA (pseudouridine(1915)-N(3))-methyltransferase RlmH [Candidatus Methylopumilus rimovensis]QDD11899.1 23S rRNA (pseudouridine(1915)-N(3))-methyltransferase RlmH [Candidatus Methylopumilus rimovensis]
MKIKIISIGNKMPAWINEAFDSYISKLNRDFTLQLIEIKPEKKFDSIEQKKLSESEKILSHVDKEFLIVLDEKGLQFSSQELAQKLKHWSEHFKHITFVIGGADGVHEDILHKANLTWSLSKSTFPHAFVRVLIAEQLYRAQSILENHPYHRE